MAGAVGESSLEEKLGLRAQEGGVLGEEQAWY